MYTGGLSGKGEPNRGRAFGQSGKTRPQHASNRHLKTSSDGESITSCESLFNKQCGHGDCLSVNMRSWFTRVPPVYFPEAICECLSLRRRFSNGFAIDVL